MNSSLDLFDKGNGTASLILANALIIGLLALLLVAGAQVVGWLRDWRRSARQVRAEVVNRRH